MIGFGLLDIETRISKTMTVVLCTVPFIKKVYMHTKKAYQRGLELNTFECCLSQKQPRQAVIRDCSVVAIRSLGSGRRVQNRNLVVHVLVNVEQFYLKSLSQLSPL